MVAIMNVGVVLNDRAYFNMNFSKPDLGNPGIGGTEYEFILLAYYLEAITEINITIYHYQSSNTMPVPNHKIISELREGIIMAKEASIDILIIRGGQTKELYSFIQKSEIRTIVWAHNDIRTDEIIAISECDYIKQVVFVGQQQCDRYIDSKISGKATYIFNMYDGVKVRRQTALNKRQIAYLGCIDSTKGFHILAKEWQKIVKRVPDAQLFVIGSGKVYATHRKLGTYGLADQEYENKFIHYLCDKNGEILPSVHFLGCMGIEKAEILEDIAVGVVNPSGMTETFGISAVEFEAFGIPVVTKRYLGLMDTTLHKKTGFLCRNSIEMRRYIIKLLQDVQLNEELGSNAIEFVNARFAHKKIIKQWIELLNSILSGKMPQRNKPYNFYMNNYKWLRVMNARLQKLGVRTPSLLCLKFFQ